MIFIHRQKNHIHRLEFIVQIYFLSTKIFMPKRSFEKIGHKKKTRNHLDIKRKILLALRRSRNFAHHTSCARLESSPIQTTNA